MQFEVTLDDYYHGIACIAILTCTGRVFSTGREEAAGVQCLCRCRVFMELHDHELCSKVPCFLHWCLLATIVLILAPGVKADF